MSHERIFGFLNDVHKSKQLKLSNGKRLSNLYELSQALDNMSDATFRNHVSGKKNDFKEWVYAHVNDLHLAQDLGQATDRTDASAMVHNRIVHLQKSKVYHHSALGRHNLSMLAEFSIGIFFGLLLGAIITKAMIG